MSNSKVHKFFTLAKFRNITNWSVSHILGMNVVGFNEKYPMVMIGDIITRSTETINIEDDKDYKQVTVKINGEGAVPRSDKEKEGKKIGTKKQYVVHTDQFIMSRIDARNGAFGVIGSKLDGAIVTADFPVFDVDKSRVLPEYLKLISSTSRFVEFAKSCSSGTTNRQRIDVNQFLLQRIPLPSLAEQKKMFSAFDEKKDLIRQYEQQIDKKKEDIKQYLFKTLGFYQQTDVVQTTQSLVRFLKIIRFKNINEWGHDFTNKEKVNFSSKYPQKKIKEICLLGSGGTPSRTKKDYYNGRIPWIKTGEVLNNEIFETEECITEKAIENSSAKVYPKGSLIIAMYGQGDTRGRTAKMGIDAATNQACAVLYNINHDVIITDFLWYFLQCQYNDLRSLASGNNQPNLNAGKISNYDVVVPPIDVQNAIVNQINEEKKDIKDLEEKADLLRNDALKEFEKEIFE